MSNQFPDRKRIRLKDYDYTKPGYYFITINTNKRIKHISKIRNGKVDLNESGKVIDNVWNDLPNHYPNCALGEYVIMPDHFHGIIKLNECRERFVTICGKNEKTNRTNHGLPEIIRGFKTFSSKAINEKIKPDQKFRWQKSYHDRIIRNEYELNNVRKYILDNPINWEYDKNNPSNVDL